MAVLPPQNRTQQRAGSGFTNLNQYLNANKSNKLGQAVAGGVQQAGTAARGAINQAGQNFQTSVDQEKARLGQVGNQAGQILADPSKANETDVDSFQRVLAGESKGPTGVSNAEELRSKAQDAQSLGQATGSNAGRYGLLQRFVGRGNANYNAGNQRLDNMLLGQTGQQQLRGAKASNAGVTSEAEHQISGAQAKGQELQGQARQLGEQVKGNLGESISGYDALMAQKLADQTANYNNIINQFKPGANAPIEMDEQTIKALSNASNGILSEGKTIYGADVSPFLSVNNLYANKQGAQSADDFAKIQGLNKLSGNYLAGTDKEKLLQSYMTDPSMVGQLAANPFAVSSESGLANVIDQQARGYSADTDAQRSILNNIASLGSGSTHTRFGDTAGNTSNLQDRLRDLYAESLGIKADAQSRGDKVGLQDALDWAQGAHAQSAPDYVYNQDQQALMKADEQGATGRAFYDQIQKNIADTTEHQNELKRMDDKYQTFRVLKGKPSV